MGLIVGIWYCRQFNKELNNCGMMIWYDGAYTYIYLLFLAGSLAVVTVVVGDIQCI